MWIYAIISVLVLIGIDQCVKYWAVTTLKPIESITIVEGFLDFTFVENRGVAFGMLSGKKFLIVLMVLVVVGILVYYFIQLPKTKEYQWARVCMTLVIAGAIGNLIDRMTRGYVVDLFEFTFIQWPVFNVADIYVVVGVIVLAILILFVIKEEPNIEQNKKEE